VYRIDDEMALVMTTDFFTPIVDDPFDFGRIAAANALSDVYAMGADPFAALNLACFPRDALPLAVLTDILRGGHAICEAAGVAVIGGHTIDDPEPKFGLAVTGRVHPDRIFTNAGAAIGDLLVLTKPLGTGIIGTAIKQGHADPAHARAAVESMVALNRGAAAAMCAVGANASTDITGFGLLGHLLNIARESAVSLEIDYPSLPVLPGVHDYIAREIVPGGTERNLVAVSPEVAWPVDFPESARFLLADAQTSGGLVISVPPDRADQLIAAIEREGAPCAVVIGRVVTSAAAPLIVRPG
jgi:selenide, water dikinase